ncbi:MAG: nitroreductase family protein [Candidatus Merdivicinus sp.]
MNEVLQTIYERRSVRDYKPDPIPEEILKEIVRAGIYAPSAMNQQSWHLTVLTGQAAERFRKFAAEQAGREAYHNSPVIVLVFGDKAAIEPIRDGTLAISSMMLAAKSLGIASCWINIVNHIFVGENSDALSALWGVPAGYVPVGSLELGYSAHPSREAAPRKDGTVTYLNE